MKNYVLDTNVLLHDPDSLLYFDENNVLIPIEVLEEIDHFKRESTELGQNARTVSRTLLRSYAINACGFARSGYERADDQATAEKIRLNAG